MVNSGFIIGFWLCFGEAVSLLSILWDKLRCEVSNSYLILLDLFLNLDMIVKVNLECNEFYKQNKVAINKQKKSYL